MMAAHNVVFAIDVDYRPEEPRPSRDLYLSSLKQWILNVLLSLGSKYGFENVRWGYKFFHSRTVKSASLLARGTDFKELHEKAFSDFEGEFVHKVGAYQVSSEEQPRLRQSPAICVQNTLKEILLDFQWDRPDITSPTKLSLRPRRSTRNTTNIPLADDDISCQGKNVVFVVSECPFSRSDTVEFLQLPNSHTGVQRDLPELILPKGLIDMLIYRKVVLHWADCCSREVNHEADDYTGLKTVMEALQPVAGKVITVLMPGLNLKHKDPNPCTRDNKGVLAFPAGSSTGYVLSSEKTYKRAFPTLIGTLFWGTEEDKQTCSVSLEPVACRQRRLRAPVEVTLRSVLQGLDNCCLKQSASECWVLFCPQKSEQNQAAVHSLFKELFILASDMLAEVSEGGQVHSAVLSVLSADMALLTVLHSEEPLSTCLVPSETTDLPDTSDLPDIVCSVLKDLMKDDDTSEQQSPHQIPEWATQELQQSTNLTTELTEGWFPLSDQSGISCHLMESMRLLHAAPEEQEDDTHVQELTNSLAELYQNSKDGSSSVSKGKKRGTQRTPVRQKMKTMSRSLQMLNVARFNVKAQKNQTETDSSSTTKGTEKRGKRCSSERTKPGPMYFKNEEELLSHLNLRYQQAVEDKSILLITQVQDLLSVVETFIKNNVDKGPSLNIFKKNLLKSAQSIRHIYGSSADSESKIRDCQLQVVLRLELCKPLTSEDQDDVEQMVEEVAGMLRVISLTKDPVYLSKFMQEEVLPLYLTSIPKVLADIYHSLGTQLPEVLVAVLPADFFSDDSMAKESVSVSPAPLSATQSLVSSVGDRLEELRNRSAKKRRTSMLTRHKSMTEAPQNLRQIEMPRKSTRQAKTKECIPPEKLNVGGQPTQKQTVQEVTKVRRNLFNQETMSSKKGKMPRSQSVSAVDIMKKRKRSQVEDGQHTLLTKKVSETPLHKQVSNRLLHRQRNSRNPGDSDMVIVEESPVKPVTDLRRSPRIKKLARRHSSVFYSSSQPRSRNLDRALSSSQLPVSESKVVGGINIKAVKSPMRLLFGAAESPARPSTSRSIFKDAEVGRLGSTDSVFENCNKTPVKSPYKQLGSPFDGKTSRTPSCSSKAQNCFFPKSPVCAVGENSMVLRGSPFRSPASKRLVLETPKKSPLKGILKTPVKSFMECGSPSGPFVRSPNMRTPRKSVTWSPSPWKGLPEQSFKVPDSPVSSIRYSPRLITPSRDQGEIFKTPEKSSQQKSKVSPKTAQRVSGITRNVAIEEPQLSQRSGKIRRTLSMSEKGDPKSPNILSYDHPSSPTPGIKTPSKSPGPTHTMCTRSGRTPLKRSPTLPLDRGTDISSLNKERSPDPTLRSPSPGSHTPVGINHLVALSNDTKHDQALHCETKFIGGQNESIQVMEEASSSDTQQFDSSQFSATSTEESIDITEASVVKTELTGGIKMNISFSRKSSKVSEVFEFTGTPALPAKSTQGCSRYGFRQTPDRQQRKAAARLGYSPGLPVFSSPQASGTPVHRKKQPVEPNPLTYQVELEMQASGLPKLKFKRTDSFNSGESSDNAAKGLVSLLNNKPSRVDSPLTHCSKHREPSCISPPHCTPGKGGVQKYICQSITPTRLHTNSPSPLGHGEHVPWTPSPQSRGRSTPESFRTWPRKKRARIGLSGTKETKEGAEILEDPELDGVFRLPGAEEPKEFRDAPAFKYTLGIPSKLCSSEETDWTESVVQNCDKTDSMKCDEFSWISGGGSLSSVVTPPHSKVKKPVSASGIFALTQSPLLYKGKKGSVTKETIQRDGSSGNSEQFGSKGTHTFNVSPVSQPRRRQACGRTYSRKRLLDS
ncbi:treslin isoform X2 [Hemibagrus wyckioides]|uniref:treslin isoform X2 n=1 Tax=Hemibagrus wyckioides TaxID=337641 RepID=UPI00266C1794|nr:treslin isoform X2 [Hemibagrus wyckioides]